MENNLLGAMLQCQDGIAIHQLLADLPLEDAIDAQVAGLLYLATGSHLPMESDLFEYGIWGYEVDFPSTLFGNEVKKILSSRLGEEAWRLAQQRLAGIESLFFYEYYEDWWDEEVYDWGDKDEVTSRSWFNIEEIKLVLEIWDTLAPVLANNHLVLNMIRLNLTELWTTGALAFLEKYLDKSVAQKIGQFRCELFLKMSSLIYANFPSDPLVMQLMKHVYQFASSQATPLLASFWETCKSMKLEWEHLEELLALALTTGSGREALDQWLLLDPLVGIPADIAQRSRLEWGHEMVLRHPKSVHLKTYLANHEEEQAKREILFLEVFKLLPAWTYFQKSKGKISLTHRLEHNFWFWGEPIIEHFKIIFSCHPDPEIEPSLRELITELKSKMGNSKKSDRLSKMLDDWAAANA